MPSFLIPLAGIIGATALWLGARVLRQSAARKANRAGYFGAVAALFGSVRLRIEPSGFARMSGVRDGLRYDLQAIPDSLSYRKLPALWVMLTLTEPTPLRTTLDVMIRPTLREPFSNFRQRPDEVALPPGFPADCALRCDDADVLPPIDLLARYGFVFADPAVKELVMSPNGLRIVILAEEADRSGYLLFRDAEIGQTPFPAHRLTPLLAGLQELRQDILHTIGSDHG